MRTVEVPRFWTRQNIKRWKLRQHEGLQFLATGHSAVLAGGISRRNQWRHLRVTFERYNGSVRVLVAEDDEGLRSVLERGLRENGYAVDAAADGARALQYLDSYEYEVAILDWRMPKVSGLEVIRRLRRRGSTLPILMLTARDAPRDRVAGLDGGADDYLVKPFDFSELLARLRALRRRAEAVQSLEIKVGQLTLNTVTRDVRMGITRPRLTATELALLEILMQRSPAAVSRSTIALAVWNNEADVLASNTLDVHLARLRAKIANSGAKVEAVRALGYRIVAP